MTSPTTLRALRRLARGQHVPKRQLAELADSGYIYHTGDNNTPRLTYKALTTLTEGDHQ